MAKKRTQNRGSTSQVQLSNLLPPGTPLFNAPSSPFDWIGATQPISPPIGITNILSGNQLSASPTPPASLPPDIQQDIDVLKTMTQLAKQYAPGPGQSVGWGLDTSEQREIAPEIREQYIKEVVIPAVQKWVEHTSMQQQFANDLNYEINKWKSILRGTHPQSNLVQQSLSSTTPYAHSSIGGLSMVATPIMPPKFEPPPDLYKAPTLGTTTRKYDVKYSESREPTSGTRNKQEALTIADLTGSLVKVGEKKNIKGALDPTYFNTNNTSSVRQYVTTSDNFMKQIRGRSGGAGDVVDTVGGTLKIKLSGQTIKWNIDYIKTFDNPAKILEGLINTIGQKFPDVMRHHFQFLSDAERTLGIKPNPQDSLVSRMQRVVQVLLKKQPANTLQPTVQSTSSTSAQDDQLMNFYSQVYSTIHTLANQVYKDNPDYFKGYKQDAENAYKHYDVQSYYTSAQLFAEDGISSYLASQFIGYITPQVK